MVIRRLPTSFQFSKTACVGVGGVFGFASSCAWVMLAWPRNSAGVASRKIKRASFFKSDLLLCIAPPCAPELPARLPGFRDQVQQVSGDRIHGAVSLA